jgi:hypothetical protein
VSKKADQRRIQRRRQHANTSRATAVAVNSVNVGDDGHEVAEDRWATVRFVVVLACLGGAQIVHWSVIDQHAREWHAAGVFFFVLALAEAAAAVALLVDLRRWIAVAVIAISVVPVVVWAWDRTLGLPFGPTQGVRGTIGRSDVLSVIFEILTVVAVWPFLRPGYGERPPSTLDLQAKIIIVTTVLYVGGFSYWAVIGDSTKVHRLSSADADAVPTSDATTVSSSTAPSSSTTSTTEAELAPTQTLSFVGTEYHFEGPVTAVAALTRLDLRNAGDEVHELELALIPPSTPTPDSEVALAELFADTQFGKKSAPKVVAAVHDTDPGATSTVVVDLVPGRYIVSCGIAAPNDQYHYAQGMIGILTVVAP